MLATHRTAVAPTGLGGTALRRQTATARRVVLCQPHKRVVTCSAADAFVNILGSTAAAAVVAGITTVTAENKESEFERLKSVEGAAPIAAAVAADAAVHSIPFLGGLIGLLTEPAGAAAGVAYLMTVVLSSNAVDPKTLAPEGTLLNAKKASDARAAVRVPFTQIVPTAIKVIDTENTGSSGKGWTPGEGGLPKLPITSVAIVLGVGVVIVESISHFFPLGNLFLPRVLQLAAWLALTGAVLDKRETKSAVAAATKESTKV